MVEIRQRVKRQPKDGISAWSLVCLGVSLLAGFALGNPVRADDGCKQALNDLIAQWRSIAVPATASAKSDLPGHVHTALEVWYMRNQLRLALRQCEQGKDHEAMLRMDVVRAWLKLPEVSHPLDHRYRFDEPN